MNYDTQMKNLKQGIDSLKNDVNKVAATKV